MINLLAAKEIERPNASEYGAKLLWCPWGTKYRKQMVTRGSFDKGYPVGAIVHFTAGRPGNGCIEYGLEQGYCFNQIDIDGTLVQTHPLNKWGYHAGKSSYKGLSQDGVSRFLVGIEIVSAGKLTTDSKPVEDNLTHQIMAKSWFDTKPRLYRARYTKGKDNQEQGWYEAYTEAQEQTLVDYLIWLKRNNPEVFKLNFVLGHDEVAPKRKNDPGAALSMSMPEFRGFLVLEYSKRDKAIV